MLRRILYTSRASEGISMRDAYDIIRVSHNRNSRVGITGGLIFLDGHFVQLMEGLPAAVETRYERIAADGRHHELAIRQDELVETPTFADEWMALRDGSRIDPALLDRFAYRPGLPQDEFDGEQVFDLLRACFDNELAAA